MIIARSPLRVSFCGGGSDIPSFYEKYGGCAYKTRICYISWHCINLHASLGFSC